MEQNNILCQIHPIEQLVFERTILVMLNKKNGLLVLDDELVSSCATDVELKTVGNCKGRKEGPGSNCISYSQISNSFCYPVENKRGFMRGELLEGHGNNSLKYFGRE